MDSEFLETFNFVVCSPKALSGHQKHDSVERITFWDTSEHVIFVFYEQGLEKYEKKIFEGKQRYIMKYVTIICIWYIVGRAERERGEREKTELNKWGRGQCR